MTYGWARDFALELLNQYSIAGDQIQESYNNQADYLRRIPKLVDDCQLLLAATEGRMREARPLGELPREERGAWAVYTLPEDCRQLAGGGLLRLDGGAAGRFSGWRLLGGNQFMIPRGLAGELWVEYYRYPRPVGPEPEDDALLDNTPEAQQTIPWYVAAHLVMYDNEFAYAALLNEFEQRRALLREAPQAELGVVEDVYDPQQWE